MLRIQKDSRQVPSVAGITANKKYFDIMYGYLQSISILADDHRRYINKKDLTFDALGKKLHLSRQTAAAHFKSLMAIGLIEYDEKERRYWLTLLDRELSTLVPAHTLKMLTDTLNERTISLYVYLLNRYVAAGERAFRVTMLQMKNFVGISSRTTCNNDVISNILLVLEQLKLINICKRYEDGKTYFEVGIVRNTILKLC